ncbi:MAG: electron transfer flavoprotein subunit beta/FixA family protein [Trueperaceae bacterium]|nr:electron transfer flavoprotein subunit beta/FixA family protein [Truepera sp.]HRN17837.1 electron transfer flavoprotein subunit beta/FixA family protein [Trueperaceae bacterium]HRQ09646.1 electron transfer flavoprotein subunit beta/FixA family protein [Trueperaceae bacterium]
MKAVTIIKQVPDAEARIRAAAGGVNLDGGTFVIDGMDEYGVEEAIRLREGGLDLEIVAVALGPERFEEALRTALALGADRAVHVVTDEALDPITQARVLAKVVEQENADIVFVGGKQADWDSAALGPALAEVLGWPQSDWTTALKLENGQASVTHDTDNGHEDLKLPLPAVITTQQGLNEPRYPTLPNIMKAKRKELAKKDLSEFAAGPALTEIVAQEIQTRDRLGKIIGGDAATAAKELVRLLRDEAKVL